MKRIFLVTPLRNEIENLPRLLDCVENQSVNIECWVIVENGSTDGSKEMLARLSSVPNVGRLVVLNIDTEGAEYQLGSKYARLVNAGFSTILENYVLDADDTIGILDADSFPELSYYEKLTSHFDSDPRLGITSGLSFDIDSGKLSSHSRSWVRGSCRLWRSSCFMMSGYIIGPSADTLSAARAELDGWKVHVTPSASFFAREVGGRAKIKYYGASAYYRGNTLTYILLRALKHVVQGKPAQGLELAQGYLEAKAVKADRLADKELRAYFRTYIVRKLRGALRVAT